MNRAIVIHGHFYQPPRENPWLDSVEVQDSAAPHHDWNERVTAECYAPNTAARRVDDKNRVLDIVNSFEKISFNVGPTLISWLERHRPDVYEKILEADRQSVAARGGHGNALAQVYNHMIMPLATRRDKVTQVRWAIEDSIVMDHTTVGKGARLRRAIVDRFNIIPADGEIGLDAAADRRAYHVDASGLVVVPRGGRREFLRGLEEF